MRVMLSVLSRRKRLTFDKCCTGRAAYFPLHGFQRFALQWPLAVCNVHTLCCRKSRKDKSPKLKKVAEKRVYPSINIRRSGTRREELLTGEEELQRMWILRKLLHGMEDLPAIEFLLDKLRDTKTNEEFFQSMKRK